MPSLSTSLCMLLGPGALPRLRNFNQLNNLEKDVDSEAKVIKPKKGRKKKTDTKMLPTINEGDTNDIREK